MEFLSAFLIPVIILMLSQESALLTSTILNHSKKADFEMVCLSSQPWRIISQTFSNNDADGDEVSDLSVFFVLVKVESFRHLQSFL